MGIIEEIYDMVNEETWMDEPFKILVPFPIMSAILRRSFYASVSVRKFYPNIYTLFVGESGCGKGVAIENTIENTIEAVDSSLLLSSVFTPEGLMKDMSRRTIGYGIVCNDEIGDMISSKKYMTGMNEVLIGLYNSDKSSYTKTLVKNKYSVIKPCLTVALGTQPDRLMQLYDEKLLTGGLIPRMIIAYGRKLPPKQVSIDKKRHNRILLKLMVLNEFVRSLGNEIPVGITEDAFKEMFDYVGSISQKEIDEDVSMMLHRVLDHIVKLSIIYSVDRWFWHDVACDIGDICDTCDSSERCDTEFLKNLAENYLKSTILSDDTHNTTHTHNTHHTHVTHLTDVTELISPLPPLIWGICDTWNTDNLVIDSSIVKKSVSQITKLVFGNLSYAKSCDVVTHDVTRDTHSGSSLFIKSLSEYRQNVHLAKVKNIISKLYASGQVSTVNGLPAIKRLNILRLSHLSSSRLKEIEDTLKESGMIDITVKDRTKYILLIDEGWKEQL